MDSIECCLRGGMHGSFLKSVATAAANSGKNPPWHRRRQSVPVCRRQVRKEIIDRVPSSPTLPLHAAESSIIAGASHPIPRSPYTAPVSK